MKPYKVRKSKIDNFGLYATKDIKNGSKIIEYKGKVITRKEAEENPKYDNEKAIYLFNLNKRYDLDGDFKFNTARLINHSCNPNCEVTGTGLKVWVHSIKDIKKGEEFSYDYGFSFDEDFKNYPCRCGSINCCGYIVREVSRWRIKKKKRKNYYLTSIRYNPSDGAGGAHFDLFLDLITFLNSVILHLPIDRYFKHPTIDRT